MILVDVCNQFSSSGVVIFRNGNPNTPIWLGAVRPGNWHEDGMFHGYRDGVAEWITESRETRGS